MNQLKKYNIKVAVTVVFIMLLSWLTVSLPFIYRAQEQISLHPASPDNQQESGDFTPYGNTTEERESPGISSVSEEYLHHDHELFHNTELFLSYHQHLSISEYISFHGETLCPPPNSILL